MLPSLEQGQYIVLTLTQPVAITAGTNYSFRLAFDEPGATNSLALYLHGSVKVVGGGDDNRIGIAVRHPPGEVGTGWVTIHNTADAIANFIASVRGERAPSLLPEDALRTHLTCYAAEEALASGQPVHLSEADFQMEPLPVLVDV